MKIETIRKNSIKELKNIKKYATSGELGRLLVNIEYLHNTSTTCIYGLLTNDCYSDRAIELIKKCAVKKYFNYPSLFGGTDTSIYVGSFTKYLGDNGISRRYSFLEIYLAESIHNTRDSFIKFVKRHLS